MSNLRNKRISRDSHGVGTIMLALALATVLSTIDVLFFNISRLLIVQRQLNAICQAAALAGTCVLAKVDVSNDDQEHSKLLAAQEKARAIAANMLLRGNILNQEITNAKSVKNPSELGKALKPGCCQYFIKLADPGGESTGTSSDNLSGRVISCSIIYGFQPVLLGFLVNNCYAIKGSGAGGLPQIDSVLALDLSCSLDDETVVTFVRREWIRSPLGAGQFAHGPVGQGSHGCGLVQYVSLNCPDSPHTIANYLALDYEKEPVNGCPVNALPPQNLDQAGNRASGIITNPLHFNAYLRAHYAHYPEKAHYQAWEAAGAPYFRAQDFGTPPGNCDLSVALGGNGDAASDLAGNQATGQRACPSLNAFSDLVWEENGPLKLAYQPAAPGATQGLANNDPVPSADQNTFTDMIVNIADPRISGPSPCQSSICYSQPLRSPDHFIGFSYTFPSDDPDPVLRSQTFNFANLAVVVEAARGNLEQSPALPTGLTNGQMALIDRPVSVDGKIFDMRTIEPKDGYQMAYQRLAMLFIQPLASVLAAADNQYFQKLHQFADCRFGLVGYSSSGPLKGSNAGHALTFGSGIDQKTNPPWAGSYYVYSSPTGDPSLCPATYDCGSPTATGINDAPVQDGNGTGFRIPRIGLDANSDRYLDIVSKNKIKNEGLNKRSNGGFGSNGIYNCRAESLCDTAEAMEAALSMFHSSSYNLKGNAKNRTPARKAIVLFINGEPTAGINSSEGQNALVLAGSGHGQGNGSTCEGNGIAVFTISLNLHQGQTYNRLAEHQRLFLDDRPPSPGQSGGLSWRAGHGGKYYSCQNLNDLKEALSDIARHFAQCQR